MRADRDSQTIPDTFRTDFVPHPSAVLLNRVPRVPLRDQSLPIDLYDGGAELGFHVGVIFRKVSEEAEVLRREFWFLHFEQEPRGLLEVKLE